MKKKKKNYNRSLIPIVSFDSNLSLKLKMTSVCTNGFEAFVEKPEFGSNFDHSDGFATVGESMLKGNVCKLPTDLL